MFGKKLSVTRATLAGGVLAALALAGPVQADGGSRFPDRGPQARTAATTTAPAPTPAPSYPGPGVDTWLGKRFPPPAPIGPTLVAAEGEAGIDDLMGVVPPGATHGVIYPTCEPNFPGSCRDLRKTCKELKGGMSTNPDGSETCALPYED